MPEFTKEYRPFYKSPLHFSALLEDLAHTVGIPNPSFRGKLLWKEGDIERWTIETTIPGRMFDPNPEEFVYEEDYPDWEYSVEIAMQGAIARICQKYRKLIPSDSSTLYYGRRHMDGTPVAHVEGIGRLLAVKQYLVDREVSSARMEGMMREGMRYVDHAREAIHEANTKLDNCEKALEWISDNRQKLQVENRGLSNRNLHLENMVDLQETKINALEEQKTVLLKQITEAS